MTASDPITDLDLYWMRRALELARRGIGVTSPNPAVGCVILDRAGQVVGEGWHEYDLLDHAEIVALKRRSSTQPIACAAAQLTSPSSPAASTGRTGPCTDALIKAGLAPRGRRHHRSQPRRRRPRSCSTARRGHRDAVGACQAEARRLNEGFARWIQHQRPLVLMKVAMTLDARIAPPPAQQTPHAPYWITSDAARAAVQPLRWAADATMVGVDTVLADDPWMTDRSGLRRRRPLLRIVLDSALRMPLDSKLVSTAQNDVVVFTVSRDEARAAELRNRGVRVEILDAEAGRVPLDKVLLKLGEEGVLTLLTETGTRLNTAFLAAGLVDRLHLFIAPQIMGSDAVPAFRGLPQFVHMNEVEIERYGNDLGLSSLLIDPWPKDSEP